MADEYYFDFKHLDLGTSNIAFSKKRLKKLIETAPSAIPWCLLKMEAIASIRVRTMVCSKKIDFLAKNHCVDTNLYLVHEFLTLM